MNTLHSLQNHIPARLRILTITHPVRWQSVSLLESSKSQHPHGAIQSTSISTFHQLQRSRCPYRNYSTESVKHTSNYPSLTRCRSIHLTANPRQQEPDTHAQTETSNFQPDTLNTDTFNIGSSSSAQPFTEFSYKPNRAVTHNPRTGKPISHYTKRRRALSTSKPWHISSDELQAIYHPFKSSSDAKQKIYPLSQRVPSALEQVNIIRSEERNRIIHEYPRYIENFAAGDQIMITTYINLYRNKFERMTGTVLQRHGGNSLDAKFTVLCVRFETEYEITFPVHSPWIREIIVIKASDRHPRKKMFYIRKLEREEYETRMPRSIAYSEEEEKEREERRLQVQARQQAQGKRKR